MLALWVALAGAGEVSEPQAAPPVLAPAELPLRTPSRRLLPRPMAHLEPRARGWHVLAGAGGAVAVLGFGAAIGSQSPYLAVGTVGLGGVMFVTGAVGSTFRTLHVTGWHAPVLPGLLGLGFVGGGVAGLLAQQPVFALLFLGAPVCAIWQMAVNGDTLAKVRERRDAITIGIGRTASGTRTLQLQARW
ncbi:MAG: hypothetical protein EP330_26910 [Deltaproteobacteria bacterium]|nr:MAG: hypothetical protein EP330_26910 [Deltaproteobacteria bacterium]